MTLNVTREGELDGRGELVKISSISRSIPKPPASSPKRATNCIPKHDMNIATLHIGMKVRHPQYGVGVVRSLTEQTAEIAFDDAPRTIAPASSDLQPAESTATLIELQIPLSNLIRDTTQAVAA